MFICPQDAHLYIMHIHVIDFLVDLLCDKERFR